MKNRNNAKYLAQTNKGDTHEVINCSIIIMLYEIFSSVTIYAPQDCCSNIKCQLALLGYGSTNIKYKTNRILCQKGIPFWISCGLQTFRSVISSNRHDILFFSTINPFCFPLFNIWSKISGQKMYHLCHNDLEHLIKRKSGKINLHWHFTNYIFKKSNIAKNLKFIVLGDSIKNNLKGYIKEDTHNNHLISITHPYYSLNKKPEKAQLNKDLKIGVVGFIKHNDINNLKYINSLLNNYSNIKLYILSCTNCDLSIFKNIINLNPSNTHLSREKYNQIILDMDYLYYPYEKTTYHVSASGAIYEAIVNQIPILAAANDYFKWLFDKFGTMGYLFQTKQEINIFLQQISEKGKNQLFYDNAVRASQYIFPTNYTKYFQKILGL